MPDESRDWETLRSDVIRAAREVLSDGGLAEQVTDTILAVFDEECANRLADEFIANTKLRAMDFQNGAKMEMEPAREAAALWVGAARGLLEGAENYSEISMQFKVAGDWQWYAFVCQRVGKLTPHQARQRAEAERDELRAEVERLQAELKAVKNAAQPPEGTVTEWGVRRYSDTDTTAYRDEEAAQYMAGISPETMRVMSRQVGPWTEAREDGDDA